ncbi:P-loop ATPase, Sll1717 family [Cohnella faecalis]|uniref:Uncharacterized protein n=1 Tax=Cohnella faecalis TaxID=2315694 RepID=A0A398CGH0_9BACL|nr:hypothetical protein [Cohnella faecalis]RIE01555.1 hypothetical protein D3H35_24710 [Cohnella faecalis]
MYTLNDIFLGKNDGKKEASYRPDFENYFYDHNKIYHKVMQNEKYLVLGRKGTGKSILGEFIKKKAQNDAEWFCNLCSYKEFQFHELVNLKNGDIKPNEYISIWEWVILLELAKLCLENENLSYSETWQKLNKFVRDNFFTVKLNAMKIIEVTQQNKLSGNLFKFGGEHGKTKKYSVGSYLYYLDDLRETVFELLAETDCKYTLIYDELDDKFRNNEIYKNSIISLIKAVDKINLSMLDNRINGKVTVLLRTDIFYILNDPDLNKIKIDNSITIDWGATIQVDSPLFDLVFTKIKASVPDLKDKSRVELFTLFFPEQIRRIDTEKFLLGRTFFRPRDVVTYLNFIIEKYAQESRFKEHAFIELEKDYSTYFFQEVRNELSGHLDDLLIDEGTLLLKQYNRGEFKFKNLKEYYEKNKSIYPNIKLEEILKTFFEFGLIGNKWKKDGMDRYFYSWAYRDNKAVIDFDKEFAIHVGLRTELSL